MFVFRDHTQLVSLANTNSQLPDIIGEVKTIKKTHNDQDQTTQRVMVNIRLDKDTIVCLSVFDALASKLHEKLQVSGFEPKVIIATNINPKIMGGRLFLNATSATHFYFDEQTDASKTFYKQVVQMMGGDSATVSKYRGVQKIESVTVAELNDFILKSSPQAIEFLCTCKVTGIQTKNGYCYISCSKCYKKLQRGISTLTCTSCHDSNAVGVVRYRVEMNVSDSTDEAVFVAFDADMTKLTGIRAADVGFLNGIKVEGMDQGPLPEIITNIVGRTCTFQIKVQNYNFTSKHQSFTISRIFDGTQRRPTPTFATQPGDDMPGDDMPGDDSGTVMNHTSKSSPKLNNVPVQTTEAPENNGKVVEQIEKVSEENVEKTGRCPTGHVGTLGETKITKKKARKN